MLLRGRPLVRDDSLFFSKAVISRSYFYLVNKFIDGYYNGFNSQVAKKLGPHKACACWLLKCAGSFRLVGESNYITKKSQYRAIRKQDWKIEAIDASDSCVSGPGFEHLNGIDTLKELKLNYCAWLNDDGLAKVVRYSQKSLERLEVVSCGGVSATGLLYLQYLQKLTSLCLVTLPAVQPNERRILLDVYRNTFGTRCEVFFPPVEVKGFI